MCLDKCLTLSDLPSFICVKECDEYLLELHKTHTDPKTGYWLKDPNETARDSARKVEQPDTSKPTDITINEVIEAYCGAETLNPLTNKWREIEVFQKITNKVIELLNLVRPGSDIWRVITRDRSF